MLEARQIKMHGSNERYMLEGAIACIAAAAAAARDHFFTASIGEKVERPVQR